MLITNASKIDYTIINVQNRYYYRNGVFLDVTNKHIITNQYYYDIYTDITRKYRINENNMFDYIGDMLSVVEIGYNYLYINTLSKNTSFRRSMVIKHIHGLCFIV